MKRRRFLVEEMKEKMGRILLAHGTPLMAVSSFCYLRQTLSSTDNYWPEVKRNLRRAQGKWGRLENILGREGADKRMEGRIYVAVVQAVILFGYETWLLDSH